MTFEIAVRLLAGLFLLGTNAFFVATEFALTRLRQYSPEEIEGDEGLERAWQMTEKLEIHLTGCQVGITSTSILLGVIAEPAVTRLIELMIGTGILGSISTHSVSIVLSVILINFVHTIWGEQTPTYLGIERAKTVARYCATPLYWWTQLIYPVLYLGDRLTKATLSAFGITMERSWMDEPSEEQRPSRLDLRSQVVDVLKSGNLSKDRRDEVLNALEIDDIPVKDIMVPRNEIIFLSAENSLAENLEIIRKGKKTRYPLLGKSLEDYMGVIYASEMLADIEALRQGERLLSDLSRPVMSVSPEMSVSKLIDLFQQKHQELALIRRDDAIEGLVTITDTLETIVGSAEDPMDLEERRG